MSVRWMRPVSGVGGEVVLIRDNEDVFTIDNLENLDSHSKMVALEELNQNYFVPVISGVFDVSVHLGNIYFEVLTDCGRCSFIIKNPYVSIRNDGKKGILIRDVMGNMFRIPSLDILDKRSRDLIEMVW